MSTTLDGGGGHAPRVVSVPGRVNLIGEHVDYHNLPVLPVAIQRGIRVAFQPREDSRIRATSSDGFGPREFEWLEKLEPGPPGDWANYVKAAAQAVGARWGRLRGIDAAVTSDLPPAAGLSSSSALLTAFTLALARANGLNPTFEELMEILPEGEHFVGTRGGGMDHAAVLAAVRGSALLVRFNPVAVETVPIPAGWSFLAAHSLVMAEKSGAARAGYNARRAAGSRALERLGFQTYAAVVEGRTEADFQAMAAPLDDIDRRAFLHVAGEAVRVRTAVRALREEDASAFGRALNESHDSLRGLLRVSCGALDQLVESARQAGAIGARLTGAGFGGFAVIACHRADRDRIAAELTAGFYALRPEFDPDIHLIRVEPSAGALNA